MRIKAKPIAIAENGWGKKVELKTWDKIGEYQNKKGWKISLVIEKKEKRETK